MLVGLRLRHLALALPLTSASLIARADAVSFTPHRDFTTGVSPRTVVVGDFDHDGRPDLAVVNNGSATVSVLLNDGAGGFRPTTDFGTGGDPRGLAVGDLNGDGNLDLAVACNAANAISVLFGDGKVGVGPQADFPWCLVPDAVA